jgi:hypothetical protein
VNVSEWLALYCLFAKDSGAGNVMKSYFNDASLSANTLKFLNHQPANISEKLKAIIDYSCL